MQYQPDESSQDSPPLLTTRSWPSVSPSSLSSQQAERLTWFLFFASHSHLPILVLFSSPVHRWGHESLVRFRMCPKSKQADLVGLIPECRRMTPALWRQGLELLYGLQSSSGAVVSLCPPGAGPIQCTASSLSSITLYTHLPCLLLKAQVVTILQVNFSWEKYSKFSSSLSVCKRISVKSPSSFRSHRLLMQLVN